MLRLCKSRETQNWRGCDGYAGNNLSLCTGRETFFLARN